MRLKYEGPYTIKEMLIDLAQQDEDGDACIFDCKAIAAKLKAAEELYKGACIALKHAHSDTSEQALSYYNLDLAVCEYERAGKEEG